MVGTFSGTAEGTRPLLNLDPRWATARLDAVPLNGKTYFVAESASRGRGTDLWVSDGTAEGTAPVFPDLADPGRPRNLSKLTVFKGALYFFAETRDPARRMGLWRSDGTFEGTVLLKTIALPPYLYGGTHPPLLTPVGDALFFRADDGVHGTELWKTDGTPEGTVLVRDVNPGPAHSHPGNLTAAGGTLYRQRRRARRRALGKRRHPRGHPSRPGHPPRLLLLLPPPAHAHGGQPLLHRQRPRPRPRALGNATESLVRRQPGNVRCAAEPRPGPHPDPLPEGEGEKPVCRGSC